MTSNELIREGDRLLRRKEAAEYYTRLGYPVSASTLACLATRRGGPVYTVLSRYALYRTSDLRQWLEASSVTRTTTSETPPPPRVVPPFPVAVPPSPR